MDSHRSISSKSAHCWGYIQGICPHSDSCRYLHPADIVPCACFSSLNDLFMLTGCRYKIHAMPHVAAMRLPSPRLPTQAPPSRQTYLHASNPAALNPQHDHDYPTGPHRRCPACRNVLQCTSCPATSFSAALHDAGPARSGGLCHPSRRSIRERETVPSPNRALGRDVHTGACAPSHTSASSV